MGRQDQDLGPDWTRFPIAARLRDTSTTRRWALYRRDRNLRFHRYDQLLTSPHVDDLLQEIDRDPIAIVWVCRHRPAPPRYPAARIHR